MIEAKNKVILGNRSLLYDLKTLWANERIYIYGFKKNNFIILCPLIATNS